MAETIIEIEGLTKVYDGTVVAVNNLNLNIQRGEVFGLLGPNGAGKTTTTLMLLGLTEPTNGRARICGHNCTRDALAVKRVTGYLPDSIGFYPDLTGRENLYFTGRLNGLFGEELKERTQSTLEKVGMVEAADRKTGTYSRGMKQRLGVADVLMKNPEIIIMDEPTLGIDPEGMRQLLALIRKLAVEDGITILISSHQLHQVQQICDRVGIFVKGHLIACGSIEELGDQLRSDGNYFTELEVAPHDAALVELFKTVEGVREVAQEGNVILVRSARDCHMDLVRLVVDHGYDLTRIRQRGGDLDEIYRRYFEKAGDQYDNSAVEKQDSLWDILKGSFGKKAKQRA